MRRPSGFVSVPALALLAACAGSPSPSSPAAGAPDFAGKYVAAFENEARNEQSAAPYLEIVDLALASPEAPGALAAGLAAVDALVTVSLPSFDGVGPHALAYRSRDLFGTVATGLRQAWYASAPASGTRSSPSLPFLRGAIASALHEMALFTGDAPAAHDWGVRRGCVKAATVIGPLDWTPLRALDDPSPIDPSQPLAKTYPGVAPFAAELTPTVTRADACQLDLQSVSAVQGVRAAVVDLAVPRAGTVHLSLTTSSAAVVDAGGVRAIARPFSAGGRPVIRFGSVVVPAAGSLRVVVRVAQRGDVGPVELDAWGDDGAPLAASAPLPGTAAGLLATSASPVWIEPPPGPHGAALAAAGLLAIGDARAAEHVLETARSAQKADAPAEPAEGGEAAASRSLAFSLLYARALEAADDLPDNKIAERVRDAIERAHAAYPDAWEAKVGHARAVERRRGAGEGTTAALRVLGAPREGAPPLTSAMVAAYTALTARQLTDVSEASYDALARIAPGSPLLASVDGQMHSRSGPDQLQAACRGGLRRADTTCFEALRSQGALAEALAEIGHLRRLRDAPDALRDLELSTRILMGDREGALAVYDAMEPGERRMLEALGLAAGGHDPREARARLARDRLTARDSPFTLPPLVRALGLEADPAPRYEEEGRKLVAADRHAAFLPGAGTAVLRHLERYASDASGLVHFFLYDLRRVSGTTDVAQGATVYGPTIEGRSAARLLRKRIHKQDGRVLEPDAAANASQASDLSQLEQGDYVEQIAEGWALPGDTGQILLDTPDLLPERTSVREGVIEVRRAASVPFAMWAHPLLGTPEEKTEDGYKVSVYRIHDRAPRRIEDGVPKMERNVAVSIGTQTWAQVARAFEETIRSLADHDPAVVRWIHEAAGSGNPDGMVERVVAAAGKKIKVPGGGVLSDIAAVYGGGAQRATARTFLELGQGSRSWVIYRALRELGLQVDLAVAETEPFSTVASFPPHVGRFRHPLVVVHVEGKPDVWIDADVDGPPLPPGHISPELRGRTAMLQTGKMVTVEGKASDTGDEVDVRLALDAQGDARGTFTVLLRGRGAQTLAELFETVVGTERRAVLRNVVLGWLPWADVDDVAVSSSEGSWEVALRATVAIHGFGRPEGKDGKTWVLAGLEPVHQSVGRGVGTLGATYASRGARQEALAIEAPLQYHMHRRIELPPGATVTRAPAGVEVADPNVTARRSIKHSQALEEDFTLSLPTGTVPASRYQAFVEKVQAIDDGFMAGTRIRVK